MGWKQVTELEVGIYPCTASSWGTSKRRQSVFRLLHFRASFWVL